MLSLTGTTDALSFLMYGIQGGWISRHVILPSIYSLLIELPANLTPLEATFLQLCMMDRFVMTCHIKLLKKLKFWAGIIKKLLGQLLARYLTYLTGKNREISALPYQMNQISDSSRPNNCAI